MKVLALWLAACAGCGFAAEPWLALQPSGPAAGKHVVLVSGDEEYRSEEMLPQLAKILASRHGFRCTVLFAVDKADGTINPQERGNIPGLEALDQADVLVLFTRFRDLPDAQMKHVVDYVESGKPIVALRTATHAFQLKSSPTYAVYSSDRPDGGFGRRVLGETWVSHHGKHGQQSTLGVLVDGARQHPVLTGIGPGDLWSPTDVYTVRKPLPSDAQVLVNGQVLSGMNASDPPVAGPLNEPMMPVAWVRTGRGRVFTTTLGTSEELLQPGMRRLLVNAVYWAAGLEAKITPKLDVGLVGEYKPLPFRAGGHAKGVLPADLGR